MFVTIGIYRLRPREGKDLPVPGFKMPLYPVLPALAFLGALFVFLGLDHMAKTCYRDLVCAGTFNLYYLRDE